jgi:glycosyltransferase domain-containing protein
VNDYTLLIPTFNRPALLARLVRYFDALRVSFPILVLDSSDEPVMDANAGAIAGATRDIAHVRIDGSVPLDVKISRGVDAVRTPYLSFCADDDVVFPAAIGEAIAFLRTHPDYHVAHGYYFGFRDTTAELAIASVIYATPSIDHDSALARLYAIVRHYQPLFYGVTRTDTWRRAQERLACVDGYLFKETLQACETAILGRVARIPKLYCGRQIDIANADWSNPRLFTTHPVRWCLQEPARFFESYSTYRDTLMEALSASGPLPASRVQIERRLDLLHLRYLLADPALVFQQAEAVVSLTGETPPPLPPVKRRRAADATTVTIASAAGDGVRRGYRLEPAFMKALDPSGNPRALLDREDVLETLRTLEHYQ